MYKKIATYFSLAILILFIAYIIYDTAKVSTSAVQSDANQSEIVYEAKWNIAKTIKIPFGELKAVSSCDSILVVGGENYLAAYNSVDNSPIWNIKTEKTIIALSVNNDKIYASVGESLKLYDLKGNFIEEWGSFDEEAIITSITSNKDYVAFADARNKLVFVLNKDGSLKYFFGQPGNQFIVPSPYFDLTFIGENKLAIANPGKRQIEYRTIRGEIIEVFGEEGIGLDQFCGCCNPAHFAVFPDGNIVTAEKGINRIKVLDSNGNLVELVIQSSDFKAYIPLDIAISKTGEIYAANGYDSILYIFKRNITKQ